MNQRNTPFPHTKWGHDEASLVWLGPLRFGSLQTLFVNSYGRLEHAPFVLPCDERLSRQLRKCKTDMYKGLEWDNPDRPECTNLLTIYQVSMYREANGADRVLFE